MSTETGGPAFPVANYDHQTFQAETVEEHRRLLSGMTMRDYFAARAMQGVLGNTKGQFGRGYPDANMNLAVASYAIADAMLAARESAAKQADHTCPGCGGKGWTASCNQCTPY